MGQLSAPTPALQFLICAWPASAKTEEQAIARAAIVILMGFMIYRLSTLRFGSNGTRYL
jgi:hypothetical protein